MAFKFMTDVYFTKSDREILANIKTCRQFIAGLITQRREALAKDPSLKERTDFLNIVLTNDTTKDDDELITDECLTFYFAGF